MVAFFVISTHLGGAERSLLDLVIELKKRNRRFVVVVPKSSGPLLDHFNAEDIPYQVIPLPKLFLGISRRHWFRHLVTLLFCLPQLISWFRATNNWVKAQSITTIHSTGMKFHILLGLLARWNPQLRVVIHMRDWVQRPILQKVLRTLGTVSNVSFIANSQVTADSLSPLPCPVIYNGIRPAATQEEPKNWRQELQIPTGASLIGIVAVIARWKGQREFLKMGQELLIRGHDCHFLIVGSEIYDTDGDKGELSHLKEWVARCNHSDRFHFLEFQKDISSVYRSLNVLVHSSIQPEPFGRVVVEAMMHSCPVTASAQGGPLEIIASEKSGLLHSPGDSNDMADNVERLLTHPDLKDQLVQAALLRAQDFSMDSHILAMERALSITP